MQSPEEQQRRIENLERRLRRAEKIADDAWNIAFGAVFLAVLFKFGAIGVLVGILVLALIAQGRRMSR